MVELDISLLGSFQVLWLGEPVTQFRSNKVRALLAYLSVEHNQPHQREKLAGLLWPEQTEGAARTNLRHSLSNLRTAIQDREGEPLLQITPQTIGFTPDSRVCIDLVRFLDITDPQEDLDFQQELNYLEKAKELYRGDFLDGFSLPDCLAFEEWLTLERERLQILYLDVLKRLGHIYQQQGEIDLAISCAREQLALNPYHEKAHRQVMRLLWLSGRIGEAAAQYQVCRQILQDEVGVDPSEITKQLYQTIREGSLPSFDQVADSEFIYQVSPPNFLAESRSAKQPLYIRPDPIFTQLEGYLAQATGGQFQCIFVSGEAGSGKTTLLNQFISQAVENNPELIIAKGSCSSISDVDAPYAPFRRAFNQMSGEIEPYWKSGLVSTSYVRQLWNAMVFVARCLIEYGPDLFGSLIHRKKFYQRLKSALGNEDIPILRFLRSTLSASPSEEGKQQSFLFEQAGNVLEAISSRYPLILILDDIQWIDLSSSSLLFHLGKRLKNSPILLVCAYRPAEIPHEYQGETHPIQKIFTEFKRRFGNVWIDLDDYNRSNGLAFTHSYIDTEPNRLDDTFRESLFRLTSGNPLFTIELLRTMQVRGELRLDDEGVWMAEPILSWDQMPARVEGAIEERVNRLPPDLQEILSIASIEGDVFTPEVIWQICSGLSPEAQKNFIDELVKKHQLFRYHDMIRVNHRTLIRYCFSHGLIRTFVYSQLDQYRKNEYHLGVGTALEYLFADQLDEIAAQLAAHFKAAPKKAQIYHRLAGQTAFEQFAFQEGFKHCDEALSLTTEDDFQERYDLHLMKVKANIICSDYKSAEEDFQKLYAIAEKLDDPLKIAEIALEETRLALQTGDLKKMLAAATKAEEIARENAHPKFEAMALRQAARALDGLQDFSQSEQKFKRGLEIAYQINDEWLIAEISRNFNTLYLFRGQIEKARPYLETALEVFRRLNQPAGEIKALSSLSHFYVFQNDFQKSIETQLILIELIRKVGWRFYEATILSNLASDFEDIGLYDQSISYATEAFELADEYEIQNIRVGSLVNIALAFLGQGNIWLAKQKAGQALSFAKGNINKTSTMYSLDVLAKISLLEGSPDEAYRLSKAALEHGENFAWKTFSQGCRALMALSALEMGDGSEAMSLTECILADLENDSFDHHSAHVGTLFFCYRVLAAVEDRRAGSVLELAYKILMERADKFTNLEYKSSYLENVSVHAELIEAYQTHLGEKVL